MRLLNVRDLKFRTFKPTDVPEYIVASHRWSVDTNEEVVTKDIERRRNTHKNGYKKVEGYATYIRENFQNIDWLWIDTCCVNQQSSQEVSEAVNSMFRWYSKAKLCIVYLADVVAAHDLDELRRSSWFRRGWTLQELIAPRDIIFLTNDWQFIGYKGDGGSQLVTGPLTGPPLENILADITGVPEKVLREGWESEVVDAEDIFRWMAHRETAKEEDLFYCLVGLFGVSLVANYGEGKDRAEERLLEEINKASMWKRFRDTGRLLPLSSPPNVGARAHGIDRDIEIRRNCSLNDSSSRQDFDAEVIKRCNNGETPSQPFSMLPFLSGSGSVMDMIWVGRSAMDGWIEPSAAAFESLKGWLDATSSKAIRDHCLACRTNDTCQWILGRPEIATWLQPPRKGGTLWLHAPPGFGKSVTFAALAEYLQEDSSNIVLTCFCSATDDKLRVPANILRTCLAQAIYKRRDFFQIIANAKQRSDSQIATETELEQLISKVAKAEPGLVIMVDGYDECLEFESDYHRRCGRSRADFLRTLCITVSHTPSRLIIASRDEEDIRSAMRHTDNLSTKAGIVEYRIQAEDVQDDIRRFSEQQVRAFKSLKNREEGLQAEIAQSLANNSGGMFLWVRLQSRQLAGARNVASLRKQISGKPQGLDEFYERDWQRIQSNESSERDRSLLILRWVTFAVRPLSAHELFEAIAIESDGSGFVLSEDCLPDQVVTDELIESDLLEPCKPFLMLQGHENDDSNDSGHAIQVAHFSMKTFLLEKFSGRPASSVSSVQDGVVARYCIGYVAAGLPWIEIEVPDEELRSHPLLMYAAQNWMLHLDTSQVSHQEALQATQVLFDPQNPYWVRWRDLFEKIIDTEDVAYVSNVNDLKYVAIGSGSRSYYAALFGLCNALRQNIRTTPTEVNALGGRYGTPLQAACVKSHAELVDILLIAEANANSHSGLWGSALNAAAVVGDVDIVLSLLEKGVDLGLVDGFGRNAILLAARQNHPRVLRVLMEAGADAAIADNDGITAIHASILQEHVEVVKFLLQENVNLEAKDNEGWTPLHMAAGFGFTEIVRLLLEENVNLEATNNYGWTPLHAAAECGHTEIARLLLEEKTVNLEVKNVDGWTPLLVAARNGHTEIVRLLLEGKTVNLEAKSNDEWTPLLVAAQCGHTEIVRLFLEEKVNLEATNNQGRTALHGAAQCGHTEIARLLLEEKTVNLEAKGNDEWTPLLYAAGDGHIEIVRLLLEEKVNLEATNNHGWTALLVAAGNGHTEIVDILLEAGAVCTVQNNYGCTAVNLASHFGHTKIVRLLLEKNVNLETASNSGWTPVYAASCSGYIETVKVLLENSVDVNIANNFGLTPIHAASNNGYIEMVKVLLDAGADVNVQGGLYGNALQAASRNGHEKVVQMLLDAGADANARGGHYDNALTAASYEGHEKVVQMLLDAGADTNARVEHYGNALTAASYKGHEKVVQMLLDAGADTNARGGYYDNALQAASHKGHEKVVQMLLDAGADVKAGGGAFHFAAWAAIVGGHDRTVSRLREGGAVDISMRDKLGRSLIHVAASLGCSNGVNLAMANSQSIHELDNQKWTPLHWAAYFGMSDTVRLLLEHGANNDSRDWRGWTPSQVATFSGHPSVADLLIAVQSQNSTDDPGPAPGQILAGFCNGCTHVSLSSQDVSRFALVYIADNTQNLVENQHHCITCPNAPGYNLCFRCARDADDVHPRHTFTTTYRDESAKN